MSQTAPAAPFNSDVQAAIDAAVQAGIQAALRQGPAVAPQPSSIVPATATPAPLTEGRVASPDGFVTVLNPLSVAPPSPPPVDASSSSAKAIPPQVPSPSLKPAGVAPRPSSASLWGSVGTAIGPPFSNTQHVAKPSVSTPPRPVNPDDVTVKKAVSNPKYAEKIDYANFVVDGQRFIIPARRFQEESEAARTLLARKSERPDGVILITDLKAIDFERFLDVIHCDITQRLALSSKEQWISVLKVAHRFSFASVRKHAIKHLTTITSCIDKLVLAREFGVDEWVAGARREVCAMPELPADEDIDRLGFELFKSIIRVRGKMSTMPVPLDEDVDRIVEDVFRPPTPLTSSVSPKVKKGKKTTIAEDWVAGRASSS